MPSPLAAVIPTRYHQGQNSGFKKRLKVYTAGNKNVRRKGGG